MKKHILIIVLAVLAAVPAALNAAETLFSYSSDTIAPGIVQACFKEKYFEYNTLNDFYPNGEYYDGLIKDVKDDKSMLHGMMLNFGMRVGIMEGLSAGVDFLYIFQQLKTYDFNNLHSVALTAEKKLGESASVIAGIRVPVYHRIEGDVRLIDSNDKLNAIAGLSLTGRLLFLDLSAEGVIEQCLYTDVMYQREGFFSAAAGLVIYNDPLKQKISLIAEEAGYLYGHRKYFGAVWKTVPQVRVDFHNDFFFVVGVEMINYAENVITSQFDKLSYVLKLNYSINSPKRGMKAADENEGEDSGAAQGYDEQYSIPGLAPTPSPTPAETPIP